MRQLDKYDKLKVVGAAAAVVAVGVGGVAVATADAPIFNCSEYIKTAVQPHDSDQMVPVLGRAVKACFDKEISMFHKTTNDDGSLHTLSADIPLRNGSKIVFAMDSKVATSDAAFADQATRVEVLTIDQDDRMGGDVSLYKDSTFVSQWIGSAAQENDQNQISRVTVSTEYRTADSPWEVTTYPEGMLRDDPQNPNLVSCVKEELFSDLKELVATDGGAASVPVIAAPALTGDCKLY